MRRSSQKALLVTTDGVCQFPSTAQLIHGDDTEYWLYRMEWEREDDDALIGKFNQIMARIRQDFGTDMASFRVRFKERNKAVSTLASLKLQQQRS